MSAPIRPNRPASSGVPVAATLAANLIRQRADATDARGGMRAPIVAQSRQEEEARTNARLNAGAASTNELFDHYSALADAHARLADYLLRQAHALGGTDAPRSDLDVLSR